MNPEALQELLRNPSLLMFGVAGGVGLIFFFSLLSRFLHICRPSAILIFSGRKHRRADGTEAGYRVVFGGRAWRMPIVESVEEMDMRTIPIDVSVQNAYTKVGIPLKVRAIANVKISSNPEIVMNAVERFLGRNPAELQQVAKETLEGNLRGVLATLTPEEVNEDRLKFADSLAQEAEQDLSKLGLHLDVLKIQHVNDDANYLSSIGRERIAAVLRDAEIAESNAKNEAAKETAGAEMRSKVAQADAERAIVQKRNDLRRIAAELEAQARSMEERAEAGALAARSVAEQALQAVRRNLEALRLEADVIVPSEVEREAQVLIAAGAAAPIAEDGRATAASLKVVSEAWAKAGTGARDIFLLNKLEEIVAIVADAVGKIDIDRVELIDSGDGRALPSFVSAYPATVAQVLRSLAETTGIDVTALLAPRDGAGLGATGRSAT